MSEHTNGNGNGTDIADRMERGLLGSVLRWQEIFSEVVGKVRAEDFRVDAHQWVWRGLVALFEQSKPLDLNFLADWLKQRGKIEDIGGYGFLGDLWDVEATGHKAVHYADQVRRISVLRQLAFAGNEISSRAGESAATAEEVLEQAERRIFDIAEMGTEGEVVSLGDAVREYFDLYDARAARSDGKDVPGVPTGFVDIDRLTGGLHDSEVIVVAARTSVGKTAFAWQIAQHVAIKCGEPVLMVSLEQARHELVQRSLSSHGQINSQGLRLSRLAKEDVARMVSAGNEISGAPLFIADAPSQSVLQVAANARRLKRRKGLRLLVVDYMQLMQAADRRAPRQEQVADISRRLKILARDLQVPVMALAQLNRGAEEHARPRLSDLRESGAIEQDADVVMLLHRPKGQTGVIDVLVEKQRNGPTDDVRLVFRGEFMRFENYAECRTMPFAEIPR